ncbi:MAG TPA: peroxiredoxin [Polyangiaceae bacterium]|nr:peroxiredoxin [Polyangiaceae bacterium]
MSTPKLHWMLWLILTVVLIGCTRGDLIAVGSPAPELVGVAPDGKRVALSTLRGQPVVVYFYPKDNTSGCTTEACGFRDAYGQYQLRHVEIFGVSRDSKESHEEFRREHKLPFVLVADSNGSIAKAYGVGSIFGLNARVTFLIGPDGKVARVWPDVTPATHPKEVLAAVDSLPRLPAEAAP